MPPKRKLSPIAEGFANALAGKRPRGGYVVVRKKSRGSRVSVSAKIDASYKETTSARNAHSYICLCRLPIDGSLEDDEENGEDQEKPRCDGGENCLCKKPAAEHPDHVWSMTDAGYKKLGKALIQVLVRDPDFFGMYTYNDHLGYGVMEAVENLLLDFGEAKGKWKEQWSICEATAVLFLRSEVGPLFMVDDSEMAGMLCRLVATMFLTMLATLERYNLLKPDSEIENLAPIMALCILIAQQDVSVDGFEDLDTRVLAYATKYKIALKDVPGMRSRIDDLQPKAEIELPGFKSRRYDPWQWKKTFEDYDCEVEELPFYAIKPNRMGGDGLDLTGWSAERRKAFSDDKDPLEDKAADALGVINRGLGEWGLSQLASIS